MAGRYRTDVLVVGGGPVGLFAALELAQRGIAVEVIDGQPRTAARSYALALHPGSLELLDRHGLVAELRERGHRIDGIAFYDAVERRCELDLRQLGGSHPFVLVLPQQALEDALEARLRDQGVSVRWGYRLAQLELGDRRARARIDRLVSNPGGYVSAATRWVIDRTVETRAAFVVGADGYHSAVRRALGVDFEEQAPHQLFGIFELDAGPAPVREVRVALDDTRSDVLWPIRDDRLRWSFQLDESLELETRSRTKSRRVVQVGEDVFPFLDEEKLRRLLAARAPWFGAEVGGITWSVGVRFEQRLASSFGRGNAWLAGDAAHVAAPVGVQSMNVGLREARDLTDAIHRILRQEASPELLDAYGRAHRDEWRRLLGGEVRARNGAAPWVERHKNRVVPCLPASGTHLEQLLQQIGLELAP